MRTDGYNIPLSWCSLRDLVVSNLSDDGVDNEDKERRTSYNLYKTHLCMQRHTRRHLDHAVFHIASSLLNMESVIGFRLQGTSRDLKPYDRRINEAV